MVGIFAYAIPRIADYSAVWATIRDLTPIEFVSLFAAMPFHLFTYWLANMAALPGLGLAKAAVVTQTTTSVATPFPLAVRSPSASRTRSCTRGGFSGQAITLYIGITGVWNVFVKLALPVVSLVLLALTGQVNAALLVASLIGLAILVVAVVLFALALSNKRFAHRIGDGIGRLLSWFRRPFHKPPITSWASRRWPSASARSSWSPGAGRC